MATGDGAASPRTKPRYVSALAAMFRNYTQSGCRRLRNPGYLPPERSFRNEQISSGVAIIAIIASSCVSTQPTRQLVMADGRLELGTSTYRS